MSVENTITQGDLSVSRNIAAGGRLTVQGNAVVKHNLRVEGWLDAENIKGANKGLFYNSSDLLTTYPNPQEGWFAGVYNNNTPPTFTIWVAHSGVWTQTTSTFTVEADASALSELELAQAQEMHQEVQTLYEQLQTQIAAVEELRSQVQGGSSEAIAAETATRISEDTDIRSELSNRMLVNVTKLFNLAANQVMTIGTAQSLISNLPVARRNLYRVPGVILTFRTAGDKWEMWQWVGSSVSNWNGNPYWVKLHTSERGALNFEIGNNTLVPVSGRLISDDGNGMVARMSVNGVQTGVASTMMLQPGNNIISLELEDETIDGLPDGLFDGCTFDSLHLPEGITICSMANQDDATITELCLPTTIATIYAATLANTETEELVLTGLPPAIDTPSAMSAISSLTIPAEHLTSYLCSADWQTTIAAIRNNGGDVKLSNGTQVGNDSTLSLSYVHVQDEKSASWIISHNLKSYPSVTVVDANDNVVMGEVIYTNDNTIQINFSEPIAGTAYLN